MKKMPREHLNLLTLEADRATTFTSGMKYRREMNQGMEPRAVYAALAPGLSLRAPHGWLVRMQDFEPGRWESRYEATGSGLI